MKLYLKLVFLVGFVFAISNTAQAQLVEQAQQSVAASHNMPLNDEVYGTLQEPESRIEIPAPRIPIGQEALKAIKSQTNKPVISPADIPTLKSSQMSTYQSTTGCSVNPAGGSAPSDIHGAVGTTNLVVVTNTHIGVYNKSSCTRVSFESLKNFFSAAGSSGQSLFDPRVLYDISRGRFFVTAESRNGSNHDQYQFFAVSQDSSGTSWWLYRIMLSQGTTTWCKRKDSNFWDYPSAGYDKSNWYITANEFAPYDVKGAIIAIDKSKTLNGRRTVATCHYSLASNIQPPIVLDSASSAYFLSPGSGFGDSIKRYKFTPTGSNGAGSLSSPSTISIPSWTAAPDAKQPNGQKLDTLDGRFQSATIQRGNYLWNVHTIAYNDISGLVFYKFSTTETAPVRRFGMYIGGARPYTFNPSTVVSPSGRAFITASYTSATAKPEMVIIQGSDSVFSGWYYTTIAKSSSQFVTDGFGNYCNDTSRGCCRWGDYSSTQLDPSNMEKAWGFNQLANDAPYGANQFSWLTHAGHVSGSSSAFSFFPAIYYLLLN